MEEPTQHETAEEQRPTNAAKTHRRTLGFIGVAAVVTASVLATSLLQMNDAPHLTLSTAAAERNARPEMAVFEDATNLEFKLERGAVKPAGRADGYVLEPAPVEEIRDMLTEKFGVAFQSTDGGFVGSSKNASAVVDEGGSWSFSSFAPLPTPCATTGKLPAPEDVTISTLAPVPAEASKDLEVPDDAVQCITPTKGVLSNDRVRELATKLFAELDAPELDDVKVAYGTASAEVVVDGKLTGLHWTARFDEKGNVEGATGISGRFEKLGSYRTLSTKDAVKRLGDPRWVYASSGVARALPMTASDQAVASPVTPKTSVPKPTVAPRVLETTPANPTPTLTPPPTGGAGLTVTSPTSPPLPEGLPTPPQTAPIAPGPDETPSTPPGTYVPMTVPPVEFRGQKRTVTFSAADLRLGAHTASIDGELKTVLAPSWWFSTETGETWNVVAIADEDVELDDTTTSTTPEADPQPSLPQIDRGAFESVRVKVIGMSEDEAVKLGEKAGMVVRIAMRDGESFMMTMDYSDSRLNLVVENDVVVTAGIG